MKVVHFLITALAFLCLGSASAQFQRKWHSFSPDQKLPSSEVYRVVKDSHGDFWFPTDRGVARWDGFELKVYTTKHGLTDNVIINLVLDDYDRPWVVGLNDQLAWFDRSSDTWHSSSINETIRAQRISPIHGLYFSADTIWLQSGINGLTRMVGERFDDFREPPVSTTCHTTCYPCKGRRLTCTNLKTGIQDHKLEFRDSGLDTVLRLTNLSGGLYSNPDVIAMQNQLMVYHPDHGWMFHRVGRAIYVERMGRTVWIGEYKIGLIRFRVQNGELVPLDTLMRGYSPTDIENDPVTGNLWVSTLEEGVFFTKNPDIFNLNGTGETSVYPAKDSMLMILEGTNAFLHRCQEIHLGKRSLVAKREFPGIVKSYGWFEDGDSVFSSTDTPGKVFGYIRAAGHSRNKNDGRLIIHQGKGIDVLRRAKTQGRWRTTHNSFMVTKMVVSSLWVGKDSALMGTVQGLELMEYSEPDDDTLILRYGVLIHWADLEKAGGTKFSNVIKDISVSIIEETPWGGYVVGTKGDGVIFLDRNLNVARQVNERLKNPIINSLAFDQHARLWLATSSGVTIWDPERDELYELNTEDGLMNNEVTTIAPAARVMALGTKRGVSIVPQSIFLDYEVLPPKVRFEYLDQGSGPLSERMEVVNNERGKVGFILAPADISLANSHTLQFRWDGGQWTEYQGGMISPIDLGYGDHDLEVRSVDGYGNPSPTVLAGRLDLLYPFWMRWWFIGLMAVILIAIFVLIMRVRERRLTRKLEEIKRREVEIAELELQALRSQMNSHFLFNSLNSVSYYIAKNEAETSSEFLSDFARLIRMVLDFSKRKQVPLREELEFLQRYVSFEQRRLDMEIEFQVVLDPDVDSNVTLPVLLIQPHIENAIHHGIMELQGLGKIELHVYREDDSHLRILVVDNGVGREASKAKRTHRSYGMLISNERLDLMSQVMEDHLRVEVTDLHGEDGGAMGTQVELFLKVGEPIMQHQELL